MFTEKFAVCSIKIFVLEFYAISEEARVRMRMSEKGFWLL